MKRDNPTNKFKWARRPAGLFVFCLVCCGVFCIVLLETTFIQQTRDYFFNLFRMAWKESGRDQVVTALPSKAFKVSALESDLEEDGRFTRASLPIVSTCRSSAKLMEDTKGIEMVAITWLALTQQAFKHRQAYLYMCSHVLKSLLCMRADTGCS